MQKNKEILIGKYLSGNASPQEIEKLLSWLDENPSHKSEFDEAEKLWKLSLNLKKDNESDVDLAWDDFKLLAESQTKIATTKTSYMWLRVAAAVALFVVMGLVVRVFFTDNSTTSPAILSNAAEPNPAPVTVNTQDLTPVASSTVGAQQPVKLKTKQTKKRSMVNINTIAMVTISTEDSAKIFLLPDNSIVYLNANSKLEYPENFNKTNRRVSLVGEAYFEIKKDSGQFVVACENTIIRGKSTSFNVKSRPTDKEVEVIVASGQAEFSGIGYKDFKKLVINPGESGIYKKENSHITKSKHHRKNYKWWQKKSFREKIKRFFDNLLGRNSAKGTINPGK